MAEQWFIDETKKRSLVLAVVRIRSEDVGRLRVQVRKLVPHGRSYLHFNSERPEVITKALREFAKMPIEATLISVPAGVPAHEARERAVRQVARLAKLRLPQRIVFELDTSMEVHDRRWLRSELGGKSGIEYAHLGKTGDPLLWIADGIAWAVQRGGESLAKVTNVIVKRIVA